MRCLVQMHTNGLYATFGKHVKFVHFCFMLAGLTRSAQTRDHILHIDCGSMETSEFVSACQISVHMLPAEWTAWSKLV